MKKRHWWNPKLSIVSFCVVLWIFHALLMFYLAEHDIVSRFFAAGDHVPGWMLSCAALFMVIRLVALLLVPALLSWRISMFIINRINCVSTYSSERRSKSEM